MKGAILRHARVALGLCGMVVLLGQGHAQPAEGQAAVDPTMQAPAPPTLGDVRAEVGAAVKDAVGMTGTPAAAAAASAVDSDDPAVRAVALRRKTLRDEDFIDSDETNRDPFKSFMSLFVDKGVPKIRQVPAIFQKFALEELSLIAIVSGVPKPRAMFRDPGGFGRSVTRGDYISKSGARITKILSDRVILEITETGLSGEPRAVEKAVLVHPEAEAQK